MFPLPEREIGLRHLNPDALIPCSYSCLVIFIKSL
nr:MAG TPA_asm: hypothetical protein [Caudoviricetes sp.]